MNIKSLIVSIINEQHTTDIDLFKSTLSNTNIKGKFLNNKEAEALQHEIERNYTPKGELRFGRDDNDIRTKLFNYDNPIAEKTINGVVLRIAEGLVRNNQKTYLLYANGKIIGEFYSVNDIKEVIDYIEKRLNNKTLK